MFVPGAAVYDRRQSRTLLLRPASVLGWIGTRIFNVEEENRMDTSMAEGAVPVVQHDHDVQFYEDEQFLSNAVGAYIAPGLREGHPVIVISTPKHSSAFKS